MIKKFLFLVPFALFLCIHAHARTASDWNEFESAHGCEYDIMLFCKNFLPKTDAVLDCLHKNYMALSLQCWKDLDFFAKKFPNSRWSRFERK